MDFFSLFKQKFSYGTDRSFNSMFGVNPYTMKRVYEIAIDLNISHDPFHIFWVFSFLKCYSTIDVLHTTWGVSYNTFNTHVWDVLNGFDLKWNNVDFEERRHHKSIILDGYWIRSIIDATECFICRPIANQHLLYSGYKKRHTLKYTVIITLFDKIIINVDVMIFLILGSLFWSN